MIYSEHDEAYFCEASDLGLKPGEVPQTLDTEHGTFTLDRAHVERDGDVSFWKYVQTGSPDLVVFND